MDLLASYLNSITFDRHQLISFPVQFDEADNHHDDFEFLTDIFQVVRENIVSNSNKTKFRNDKVG